LKPLKIHISLKSARYIERTNELFSFYHQTGFLSQLQRLVKDKPVIKVPVRELVWILDGADVNVNKKFSLAKPIPMVFWNGLLTALTDLDQIAYAQKTGVTQLPAKLISPNELATLIRIPKIARELHMNINLLPEHYLIPVDLLEPLENLEEVDITEDTQLLVPPPPTTSEGGSLCYQVN
jgi:hypothetical protein